MSNRTLLILTALMLAGLAILVAINMSDILMGQSPNQFLIRYNDVRGMAVSHQGKEYTLNFQQQNQVVDFLNQSTALDKLESDQQLSLDMQKLTIYRFNGEPDIVLTPVAEFEDDLVFSVPPLVPPFIPRQYLLESSEGSFKKLLMQTYD